MKRTNRWIFPARLPKSREELVETLQRGGKKGVERAIGVGIVQVRHHLVRVAWLSGRATKDIHGHDSTRDGCRVFTADATTSASRGGKCRMIKGKRGDDYNNITFCAR